MKKIRLFGAFLISLYSLSAPAQWLQSSFIPASLAEVVFPASNAAYATGYQYIYKSTDGGITWNQIHDSGPFANFTDLYFVNGDTGFVNLYNDVMRTFDGGANWTSIPATDVQRLKITGEKLFSSYTNADTTFIVRSDDFGNTWTKIFQHFETGAMPYLFSFLDSLNGHFINPNEPDRVYTTSNGCISIDTTFINSPIVIQNQYDFKDHQYGYLYGSWGSQSHPTRTWNDGSFYFPIDLDGFGVLPVLDMEFHTQKLYATTLYGKIFYSTDNGSNWNEQITPVSDPVLSISFLDDNNAIAITSQAILYTHNGGFTGIEEASLKSLITVFPNPANDKLIIKNNSNMELQFSLYNSTGKKVTDMPLRNELNKLDISAYSNGIYFYQILDENKIIKSGKIVKQ